MNELIQELAYKAEEYAFEVNEDGEFHVNYTRKFAELIILECAKSVQGVPTDTLGYQTADQKIKQLFGIE